MQRNRSRSRSKSPNSKARQNGACQGTSAGPSSNVAPEDQITITANDNDYKSNPISLFDEVDFPKPFFKLFKENSFEKPTKIQANAIPIALESFDIIGIAKTGSGKTLSFVLPLLMAIEDEKNYCKENNKEYNNVKTPRALIMAPTRELVCQIYDAAKPFVNSIQQQVVLCYGGANSREQRAELENGCDILIATPGRLYDFINRGNVNLSEVFMLVLDEADRMLDMGFLPQVRNITGHLRPTRQTLLWSATWPKAVEDLSKNLCQNRPVQIRVGNEGLTINPNITQTVMVVDEFDKQNEVKRLIRSATNNPKDKVLVFVATKRCCDSVASLLSKDGFPALAIHGDKDQSQREHIMSQFKGPVNILVATDVASRGLDIKAIRVVINYDFPNNIEDYIHRIGRTGRAGAFGDSYTLFTNKDSSHGEDLVQVLEAAKQPVPSELRSMRGGYKKRSKYSSWSESSSNMATAFGMREEREKSGGFGGGDGGFGSSSGGGFGGGNDSSGGGGWGSSDGASSKPSGGGGGWGASDEGSSKPSGGGWGSSDGASNKPSGGGWGSNTEESAPSGGGKNWGSNDDEAPKASSWGSKDAASSGGKNWGSADDEEPASKGWG